jgi:hypothetical protein
LTPLEGLQCSRERLRQALQPSAHANAGRDESDKACAGWCSALLSIPAVAVVKHHLARWWSQHPLRLASAVTLQAGDALISPMAKKHPLTLVGGALLLGAAVVWTRPWRWGLTSMGLANWLPRLDSNVPVTLWLAVLSQLLDATGRGKEKSTR